MAVATVFLNACTTGQLYYLDAQGKEKLACEYEFVGLPTKLLS